MTNGEMIEILEYELDRMKDERGSDYSGVRALEQLLALLSKDHQNNNDNHTFLILFLVLLLLAVIVIDVYAFIKYGNTPITEVPAWAYFFLMGGSK